MFIIDKFRVKVKVNLEPGIYEADNESATGKTWLCNLLKQYHAYGQPVAGYTYNDYKEHLPLPSDVKLLVMDRYDMYNGAFAKELLALSKTAVVIIDSKYGARGLGLVNSCFVLIESDCLISVEQVNSMYEQVSYGSSGIFLFEDRKEAGLSEFFRKAYPQRVAGKFEYADGSGNIIKRIDELRVKYPDKRIIVYMDLVPDNKQTVKLFNKIWLRISRDYKSRVVCIPDVCMEYYYLYSIMGTNTIKPEYCTAVEKCFQVSEYYMDNVETFLNFEQYCKELCRCALIS